MKDFLKNDLNIGDDVAYITTRQSYNYLEHGKIKRFTGSFIIMENGDKRISTKVVKITK